MTQNKYTYLAIIQQNYGFGWEDNSEYQTSSSGKPLEFTDKINILGQKISLLKHDYIEYNKTGYPTRIINRKQLNNNNQ